MSDVTVSSGDATQADEAIQNLQTCVPMSQSPTSSRNTTKSTDDGSDLETKPKAPEGGRLQFYFGNNSLLYVNPNQFSV